MTGGQLGGAAERLRVLHRGQAPLLLPNAWDVASARVMEHAGFPAIATTSVGVAAALGEHDGEQMTADEAFRAIARIARHVDVPVTADIEGGYGLDPASLAERLVDSAAAGFNLEDSDHASGGLLDTAAQARRIGEIKEEGMRRGVAFVVNARIDTHVAGEADATRADEALRRARAYAAAGADCVYPIFAPPAVLRRIVEAEISVNANLHPGGPSIAELAGLGVRRVSCGGSVLLAVVRDLRRRMEALRRGDDNALFDQASA